MAGIFISYRREDSAGWTGRLAERLRQKFGAESIFMDIDTIQPGTDFTVALRSAVEACDVLLAMIGPEWSITKNAEGQLRLEDPNDWMRIELTTALSRNIPIIPVLVGGATLPKTSALPDDLRKLFHYQSHELTDKRWEFDATQLVQVLEKVVHGVKPKRYISGAPRTRPSTWAAIGVLGILLAFGSAMFLQHLNGTEDGASQKKGTSPIRDGVVNPPQESQLAEVPVSSNAGSAGKPTENTGDNQQSTTGQQAIARTVAEPNMDTAKIASSTGPTGQKGRSLPAGIEVKFSGGDLTFRLVSIRLEDESNDNWILTTSLLIRNSGQSWTDAFYSEQYRLLIDNKRTAPTKQGPYARLQSDTETSGEVTFVVPKTERRVGFRIGYGEENYTTIPIDLKTGVSRTDAQPPGIPRSLANPPYMDNLFKGEANYDFRAVALEPYNVESFALRLTIRIMANDHWFDFLGRDWRLMVEDLPYEPIKATYKRISAHAYADADILFIVPKSVTQATLRVPDGANWRNVSINLKAGKA